MFSTPRRKLAAGAVTLVAVGGITGGAIAATSSSNPRRAFLNDAANRLNVSPQRLQGAMQGAYIDQLNAAVASGKLSRTQAQRIEQRVQRRGALPWLRVRGGQGVRIKGAVKVAAKYLGLTPKQLRAQLRGGRSLAQVAQAQGKSASGLEAALLAAAKTRLDKAVANGRISSSQEQTRLSKLSARIDKLVNRQGLGRAARHG